MPLSQHPKIVETSTSLVSTLRAAAGENVPKSFRPAHAKGRLLTGTFTPTPTAATLTTAPHFTLPSTRLTLRFSSSTGHPTIPDTDPNANPRGLAIRFHLPSTADGKRHHTDIIAHSTPLFPVSTGEQFLEFLQAAGAAGTDGGKALGAFLATHPETKRFLTEDRRSPESFATERFFGVNAFKFVDGEGKERFVRYRVLPTAGHHALSPEEVAGKSATYLYDELAARVETGPPIAYKLVVQVAEEGDVVDNATVVWPEERTVVELGEIRVEGILGREKSLEEERRVIFDPVPRVQGIEGSGDPLVEVRASVYLVSGRERRGAA
ncbi:catalase related subgroup [Byssothecium circinans]|uniref:Catalase related subgroup n=1 Tax=Byssothecium circinans TaxID=147558 RepID=A0A6A5T9A5_9PLEO|nr:catalase related subgroup [Byssothecium circinans]KAF1959016.1 catalase related subgroup [Byssothecium circinans]